MKRIFLILMALGLSTWNAMAEDYSSDDFISGLTSAVEMAKDSEAQSIGQKISAMRALMYVEGYVDAIKAEQFIQGEPNNLPSIPPEGVGTMEKLIHQILAVAHEMSADGPIDSTARVVMTLAIEKNYPRPNGLAPKKPDLKPTTPQGAKDKKG